MRDGGDVAEADRAEHGECEVERVGSLVRDSLKLRAAATATPSAKAAAPHLPPQLADVDPPDTDTTEENDL